MARHLPAAEAPWNHRIGRIGTAVAARAKAFGLEVVGVRRGDSLDTLLATSDIVSVHIPLNRDTHHLIDAAAIAKMNVDRSSFNTARGPIIDEDALCDALQSGHLAGAGLDVYEFEPSVNARLLAMPNVVLAPHIGSATSRRAVRWRGSRAPTFIAFSRRTATQSVI